MSNVVPLDVIHPDDTPNTAVWKLVRKAEAGRFNTRDLAQVLENVSRYVVCPRCAAGPLQRCVTRNGRPTGTHRNRWRAAKEAVTGVTHYADEHPL